MKVRAPLKSKAPGGHTMTELDVVEPLSLVAYLWNDIGIDIPSQLVESYWAHYREVGAPWASWSSATPQHVPLALYGDDCKIRPGEKMVGLFLSFPLFRPRSVRCSKFLLFAVQEELEYKHFTMDSVLRFLVWALNCLHVGRFPRTGCDGEELRGAQAERAGKEVAPGRKFAVTELKGDWSWFKKVFRFKSSWKGGTKVPVCFHCRAGAREPFSIYYKVHADSECWRSEYTLLDWLVEQCPVRPCCLDRTKRNTHVTHDV